MAAFDTSRPQATTGSMGRIASLFTTVFAAVATWNDARLTRKSLSALSDHELNDIGMVRGDIDMLGRR